MTNTNQAKTVTLYTTTGIMKFNNVSVFRTDEKTGTSELIGMPDWCKAKAPHVYLMFANGNMMRLTQRGGFYKGSMRYDTNRVEVEAA